MKQNERLLVYAVTGFLTLILVIAVLFGGEQTNPAKQQENSAKGLSDLLEQTEPEPAPSEETEADALVKQLEASKQLVQQPLIAKPQLDCEIVERAIGFSVKDRTVRWVTVKPGDGYERLVRRWCGDESYVEEARSLNEDKVSLVAGTKVMVPLVSDAELVRLIEARALRTSSVASSGRTLGNDQGIMSSGTGPQSDAGWPTPSASTVSASNPSASTTSASTPSASVDMPGRSRPRSRASRVVADEGGRNPSVGRGRTASTLGQIYKVKPDENLWTIAAEIYGKGSAGQKVREMKELNPGLTDTIQIGQEIKLPAKGE